MKPKHLSIKEMWDLYLTLKPGLESEEDFLVDEVMSIMEKIDTASFKTSLGIMFGRDFPKEQSPIEFALMFTNGIKETGILDFAHMIRGLNGSR
jgi:hypothetical protein